MPNAGFTPPATTGSSFLTGPIGYGLGAAAGQIAGNALGSNSVNFRGKYARNQLKHQRKIWEAEREQIGPNMAAKMKALDEAGLHRLAALGITIPSSSQPTSQPMIPGQSVTGSAVSEGINTALNVARSDRLAGHQKAYQTLKLEEQQLRNDWLRSQIKNSDMQRFKELANSTRPPIALNPDQSERMKRHYLSRNNRSITGGPGSPASALEEEIGEWADWMPSTLTNAWDMFKQDLRNLTGIKGDYWERSDKEYKRNNPPKKGYLMNPARGSQRKNPRY